MNGSISYHWPDQLRSLLIVLILSFYSVLTAASDPAAIHVVRVAINDAPPYRIFNGPDVSGLYVDIFEAMLKQIGWKADYAQVPFTRALALLKTGDSDVMLGPIRRTERERYIDYSIAAFPAVDKVFVFTNPDNRIEDYEDLEGKLIGVQGGSRHNSHFDSDAGLHRFEHSSYESLLLMLSLNRLDVVLIPELLAIDLMRKLELSASFSPFEFAGEPAYIAISRKSDLMNHLETLKLALKQIRDSGEFDRIQARYLNHP